MPQFTSPRPAALRSLRKPRNPIVAPALLRQAGRHQGPKPRQGAQAELRSALADLWRPPSKID